MASPPLSTPMSDDLGRQDVSASGLSEPEAREFHRIFITSFVIFTVVAIVAHFLVWQWRPWLPGVNGYKTSLLDGAHIVVAHILPALV
jgi:light-harvesting complex 1 beta chain